MDCYNWTIDLTDPIVTIISGPSNPTNSIIATFYFNSNEQNSTFQCRIDNGSWSNCNSPKTYSDLSEGSHNFYAKATDQAGNTGQLSSYSWFIDLTGPTATFQCKIDTGIWNN